jgi:hypothetical protein
MSSRPEKDKRKKAAKRLRARQNSYLECVALFRPLTNELRFFITSFEFQLYLASTKRGQLNLALRTREIILE